MRHRIYYFVLLAMALFYMPDVYPQCGDGYPNSGFTPIDAKCGYNDTTPAIKAGQYILVKVYAGHNYTVSNCNLGDKFDSELSIYNDNTHVWYAYDDDYCTGLGTGSRSQVNFTATITGYVRVVLTLYPCLTDLSKSSPITIIDNYPGDTYYRDADGDSYGDANSTIQSCIQPAGHVANKDDCNDNDNAIHPGAAELCDGKDNDCDGLIDEDAPPTPIISANGPVSFCTGGTVTFSATSSSNYQWYKNGAAITGETNQTYITSQNGSYTVSVTGNYGCKSTSSPVVVTVGATYTYSTPQMLKDVWTGPCFGASSLPDSFYTVGNITYFAAASQTEGRELWKTDGTPAGTMMVKDLDTYSGGCVRNTDVRGNSRPHNFISLNGILYFMANDGVNGYELYRSDGTAAGTYMVKDIYPGSKSGLTDYCGLTVMGNYLYFIAHTTPTEVGLFKTDGTTAGTVQIFSASYAFPEYQRHPFVVMNNNLYFFARYSTTNGYELWKSDGTTAGTVMVKDIVSGSGSSIPYTYDYASTMCNVNGTLFFAANDINTGIELWKSDGTAVGTVLVKDIEPAQLADSRPNSMINFNGVLFFQAGTNANGGELWKSDGTAAGTVLVQDIAPGINTNSNSPNSSNPSNFAIVNSTLLFTAFTPSNGAELWKTDGTNAGTVMLKDIYPGSGSSVNNATFSSATVANRLFFSANNGTNGNELWQTDGGVCGTSMVADLNPGVGEGMPTSGVSGTPGNGTPVVVFSGDNNHVYFGGQTSNLNLEPFVLNYSEGVICRSDTTITAPLGAGCTAVVNGIDPKHAPESSTAIFNYSLSGATNGSGTGSASGLTFNKGTTKVTYSINGANGYQYCSFNVTVVSPTEICNGLDDDCDGLIDEGVGTIYYRDADGDGYGSPNFSVQNCNQTTGYVNNSNDCNDDDNTIYPGAPELCDGKDNDCDGTIDVGMGNIYYRDMDGDGYGDLNNTILSCKQPAGYTTNSNDCNDWYSSVYPGAPESCDGLDNDCDGEVDEGIGQTWWLDADGDGYSDGSAFVENCTKPTGYAAELGDCDDQDNTVYPGAPELCDGKDNNCNFFIDEGTSLKTWYQDADGDSYGNKNVSTQSCTQPAGYVTNNTDCNDRNAAVHSGTIPAKPTISGNTQVCPGKTTKLTSSSAATYLWSTGATTRAITTGNAGQYTVTITKAVNGCENTSDPVNVSILPCTAPTNLLVTNITTTGATLNWAAVNCAVKYKLQVRKVGASTWKTYNNITATSYAVTGLIAGKAYEWQVQTICDVSPLTTSDFAIGSRFTTATSLTVKAVAASSSSIDDNFDATLSPNPAQSVTTVRINRAVGEVTIVVTDVAGRLLWKKEQVSDAVISIPVASFANGTYFIHLTDKVHSKTLKLVKAE